MEKSTNNTSCNYLYYCIFMRIMCPIGMFAPVDRRETPQAQAKVKMQGFKVRTLGAKVRVNINVNVTTSQYRSSNNMEDKIAYIYIYT